MAKCQVCGGYSHTREVPCNLCQVRFYPELLKLSLGLHPRYTGLFKDIGRVKDQPGILIPSFRVGK